MDAGSQLVAQTARAKTPTDEQLRQTAIDHAIDVKKAQRKAHRGQAKRVEDQVTTYRDQVFDLWQKERVANPGAPKTTFLCDTVDSSDQVLRRFGKFTDLFLRHGYRDGSIVFAFHDDILCQARECCAQMQELCQMLRTILRHPDQVATL